jgi:hypothetical protein
MSKPDAPQPPNPIATAAAQTGTNVSTAVANAYLNNVNQNTPQGSLSYDVTGSQEWTDPSTGAKYSIPRFTSNHTLSPQGQAIQTQTDATRLNLATMANSQSSRLGSLLSNPFNASSGAPFGGTYEWLANSARPIDSFEGGGPITRSYGPEDDFSSDRQRVEDALMSRMNPQLARERGNIEQRLADQGIRYGSQAYQSAMDDYNRQATDTRFGAIGQAGQEQQRMMDMAQAQAAFQNAAQGQQFQQNAAQAAFTNAGRAQMLGQEKDIYNAAQNMRGQYMQEQYQARNQPINEITALMGGSQVQQPNFNAGNLGGNIPTTDYAGIMNQNFQNQMGVYNAQNANWQTLMGGAAGLGAAGIKASDERVKKNISKLGNVFAFNEDAEREGLPIYEYEYKRGDGRRHVGPMAQDIEKLDRGAVKNIGGVKHIDTSRVMGNILRAA